jgi:transposase
MALGRDKCSLIDEAKSIAGGENVKAVSIDLSGGYREFVRSAFPNAAIVADKFHVMRLFGRLISRERIDALGDKRQSELCKLLKRSQRNLSKKTKERLTQLLTPHPKLHQAYLLKVQMYEIYRKINKATARKHFIDMLDGMARSQNKNIIQLRSTLLSWQNEILNYYNHRISNGRVEGFNNRCKQVKRKGYGYRNFSNYARRCMGETLLKA